GPGGGEGRVAARIDVHERPVVDERHVPFEQGRDAVLRDEGPQAFGAFLFFDRSLTAQAGELAGVRGQHYALAAQKIEAFAQVKQSARVGDDGDVDRAEHAADDLAHFGGEPEARADPDRAAPPGGVHDLLDGARRFVV